MSAIPPAQAWYRRVTEVIALRGWSKQELSDRSGVARSTIDGWQRNPRRPQAKSVNAVADVLGIDRAEALRLAGVTAPAGDGTVPDDILQAVRAEYPDDEETQQRVIDAVARTLRGEPQPPPPAPASARDDRRQAG